MLAERLGKSIAELRTSMSEAEYRDWRVVEVIRAHHRDHARQVAEDRAGAGVG